MDSRAIDDSEFVVLDVETTGLGAYLGDRICEIGAVKLQKDEEIGQFWTMIDPGRPISQGVFAVNGITPEMLMDAPASEAILPDLMEFIGNSVIVAYNAKFDMRFIQSELRTAGHEDLNNTVLDVMALAKRLMPDMGRFPLWNVAQRLGISFPHQHRSMYDVRATLRIFLRFLHVLKANGARTVEDIIAAA